MAITPIVGTLAYILDQESDRVLLIRRNSRPDDDHFGKVNGLGGKVEKDENIVCGIEREIEEEAGITITEYELRGVITWTDFGPKREDWLGFIFLVTGWEGSPKSCLLYTSDAADEMRGCLVGSEMCIRDSSEE